MPSSRLSRSVRAFSLVAVAAPAIGIALLVLREGALESGGMSVNRVFHPALGAALLLWFADFTVAIRRSDEPRTILALGVAGFVVCLVGAILSEMFGPPALALLLAGGVAWTVVLLRGRPQLRSAAEG